MVMLQQDSVAVVGLIRRPVFTENLEAHRRETPQLRSAQWSRDVTPQSSD